MAGDTVITIVGNLTADPELRWISDGTAVASFTVASTPRSYDRASNSWKDGDAIFMRCSAWRELGENCAETLKKGMRVIAQGRLSQRSWESQKSGERHTSIEMTVDEIGPSLRYATAHVERNQRRDSGQGYGGAQRGYGAPAGGPVGGGVNDPWGASAGNFGGSAGGAGGYDGSPANSTFEQDPPF